MISLAEDDDVVFHFLLSFNFHFEMGKSLVVDALRGTRSLVFGQLLIMDMNRRRGDDKGVFKVFLIS